MFNELKGVIIIEATCTCTVRVAALIIVLRFFIRAFQMETSNCLSCHD